MDSLLEGLSILWWGTGFCRFNFCNTFCSDKQKKLAAMTLLLCHAML